MGARGVGKIKELLQSGRVISSRAPSSSMNRPRSLDATHHDLLFSEKPTQSEGSGILGMAVDVLGVHGTTFTSSGWIRQNCSAI